MVQNNPPAPSDSTRPPVIPPPVALYVSGELIYELYDGGQEDRRTALPQIFDSLGEARSHERKRARGSPSKFPNGIANTPRLVPAFKDPPNADLNLIANE
jgi:hypothetical protein